MKIKQTLVCGLFAAILTAIFALALAGCEQPTDPEPPYVPPVHTHQWGEWSVTTVATCIATGIKTRICSLDASHEEREEIPIDLINGHDWQSWDDAGVTIDKDPTCTEPGDGTRSCKHNSAHKDTGTGNIPALGHDYQDWTETTAPTCTEPGIETGTCSHDNEYITTRTGTLIDPTAHDAGEWHVTLAATCTATGIKELRCTRDNTVLNTDTVDALGHDPNAETGFCTRCNALAYNIGNTGPGGGIIVYCNETGFTLYHTATDDVGITAHYLEAAPNNMETKLAWASSEHIPPSFGGVDDWSGITGTETQIGTGRRNTVLILVTDENAPAAKACKDLTTGGKTDWFLPNKDELDQLYLQRTILDISSGEYWSSSQDSNMGALVQGFSDGSQGSITKNQASWVRAVRAF